MKIYTRTGDDGGTGLFGGERVSKASPRVAAYGDLDELNSCLGLARAEGLDPELDALLGRIQSALFDLGAELANPRGKDLGIPPVGPAEVTELEHAIDAADLELEPLKTFVLPGGTRAAAALHLARTVCRRAERQIVELSSHEPLRADVVHYVNRLSDLLFTLARLVNKRAQHPDVPWVGRRRG